MHQRQEVINRRLFLLPQGLFNEGFTFGLSNRTHPSTSKGDSFTNVEFVWTATADHDAVVRHVFNGVVGDFIVAALRYKDTAGMPIKFTDMMDVVVSDNVVFVFVLGPWAIS